MGNTIDSANASGNLLSTGHAVDSGIWSERWKTSAVLAVIPHAHEAMT